MDHEPTRLDNWLTKCKDHKVLCILIFLGVALIAISALTNALSDISEFYVKVASSSAADERSPSEEVIEQPSTPMDAQLLTEEYGGPVVRAQAPPDEVPRSEGASMIVTESPTRRPNENSATARHQISAEPPPIEYAETVEEMRLKLGTTELTQLEDDKTLSRSRNGCYGFANPKTISTSALRNFESIARYARLRQQRSLIHQMEVHKLENGYVYIVGYVPIQSFVRLSSSTAADLIDETIYFQSKTEDEMKVIALPIQRLTTLEHQRTSAFGPIAEATIITK